MAAAIVFIFWLLIIPFCIGLIPANFIAAEKRSPGFVLLSGYFGMWAIFEAAAVPAVLWVEYDNFKAASAAFTVLAFAGAATGVWLLYRNGKAQRPGLVSGNAGRRGFRSDAGGLQAMRSFSYRRFLTGTGIEWLVFFALLGFQLYKAAAFASFDGDDAYYVVESLIAQEAGLV